MLGSVLVRSWGCQACVRQAGLVGPSIHTKSLHISRCGSVVLLFWVHVFTSEVFDRQKTVFLYRSSFPKVSLHSLPSCGFLWLYKNACFWSLPRAVPASSKPAATATGMVYDSHAFMWPCRLDLVNLVTILTNTSPRKHLFILLTVCLKNITSQKNPNLSIKHNFNATRPASACARCTNIL